MPSHPCTDGRSCQHAKETTGVEDTGAVKTVTIAGFTGIVRDGSERLPTNQPGKRSHQCTLPLVIVRAPPDLEDQDASSGDDRSRGG
jgi:hypothetical protein